MTLDPAFLATPLAHRGLHDVTKGRAENSSKAIAAAIEAGYGIEIDLQLSSDGIPMVFHDYALDRLAEASGPVAMRTAAELGAIPLRHDGDGIPTLAEVLAQVAGQVPLLIEIKDQDGLMGPNLGPLGAATADLVRTYQGPVAMMSFNPHAVIEMRNLLPDVPRGLVTDPYTKDDWPTLPADIRTHLAQIPDYEAAACCFVSHNTHDLDAPRIAKLKQQGATILCWTVKSPQVEAEARKTADNITFEGYLA